MSGSEFVALSEERIRGIVTDHWEKTHWSAFSSHGRTVALALCDKVAALAASEASENTKRWLMEKVCEDCGSTNHDRSDLEGWVWHSWNREDGLEMFCRARLVTRAEYLSRTEPR